MCIRDRTRRWNPKMAEDIFTERNGIYIIDLQKTVKKVEEAYNFIKDITAEGKDVLFVGTKKQAQDSIKEEAQRVGMYWVNARWLGGMLTNFKTIKKRIERLEQLNRMEAVSYTHRSMEKACLKNATISARNEMMPITPISTQICKNRLWECSAKFAPAKAYFGYTIEYASEPRPIPDLSLIHI